MISLITHVPCSSCSFGEVVRHINNNVPGLRLVPVTFSFGKVNISDAYWFFDSFRFYSGKKDAIIWVDTPMDIDRKYPDYKSTVITTSEWNREVIERSGVHVDKVVPRPIDEKTATKVREETKRKKYDFVMVGANIRTNDKKWLIPSPYVYSDGEVINYDKKGVKLFLVVKGRKVLVSHDSFANFKFNSLTKEELYKVIRESRFYLALSHTEGFGLPPVEAMALGVPPIFPECHGFKDWLKGLSVKCQGYEVIETPAGRHRFYYYDDKEVLELTGQAKGMKKEEYDDLSEKVMKHAERFYSSRIVRELGLLNDPVDPVPNGLQNTVGK